jgi:ABC-2 type transport system permease protein
LEKQNRNNKNKDITQLLLSLMIIVFINVIGSFYFHRFDLTSEKRYTLSEVTKKLLGELNDVVYVKVYLEGEFPAGFRRLRNETKEMLDEFRTYSNDNVEYEFIDPSANPDKEQRENVYRQLYKKGLQPTNLEVKDDNGVSQKIIFPGALVSYKGRETPWQLLQTQMVASPEEQLNNSVQSLEYEFSNALKKLNMPIKPRVAFIQDHYELDSIGVADITHSLKEYYEVRRVSINQQIHSLDGFKAIIIAKPDSAFNERDKFIIDQFIMKGGKVLWMIDPVNTNIDSLKLRGMTFGFSSELNLEDQLFKYGVRINPNLILDLQSCYIPINKALVGNQPQWKMEPWLFYPLVTPVADHPIVKNLDLIKFQFVSTMDTIARKGVKKTILLTSSKYSKPISTPARIDLRMVNVKIDERQFNKPFQPVAVLLEGEFESLYKNRLTSEIIASKDIDFKEKSKPTKMIVVSDGDVIRNEVQRVKGEIFPLGYDVYTKQTYANKNFVLNCVNYLCNDDGLLSLRSKEFKLRLLDKKKIKLEHVKWQLINTVLPIILILIYGMIRFFVRKKKYTN